MAEEQEVFEELMDSRVKCIIRVRPCKGEGIMNVDGEKRLLIKERYRSATKEAGPGGFAERVTEYVYDRCFPSEATQAEVFLETGLPLTEHVLTGSNACCFAYGQTGSGKTYSMFGAEGGDWEKRGLIPRSVEYILERAASMEKSTGRKFQFWVSFLEIYLDKIRDLGKGAADVLRSSKLESEVTNLEAMPMPGSLHTQKSKPLPGNMMSNLRRQRSIRRNPDPPLEGDTVGANTMSLQQAMNETGSDIMERQAVFDSDNLEIMETKEGETFVNGLTQLEVKSVQDVMSVLTAGYALRKTNSTLMNEVSSRSHTVFTFTVRSTLPDGSGLLKGKLNLCDLAGSERVKKSGSVGQTFKEAVHINQSLTALAKVILALATGDNLAHVPYRDSKLTRILKDSLAGNSYTTVLANVNPLKENHDESILTLNFASRCSSIIMKPKINNVVEEPESNERLQEYEEEVVTMQRDNEGRHVSSYQAVPKGMEVNRRLVSNAEATMGATYGPGTGKGTTEIKGLTGSEMVAQAAGVTFSDQKKGAGTGGVRRKSNMQEQQAAAQAVRSTRTSVILERENEGTDDGTTATPGAESSDRTRLPLNPSEATTNLIRPSTARGASELWPPEKERTPIFKDETTVRRVRPGEVGPSPASDPEPSNTHAHGHNKRLQHSSTTANAHSSNNNSKDEPGSPSILSGVVLGPGASVDSTLVEALETVARESFSGNGPVLQVHSKLRPPPGRAGSFRVGAPPQANIMITPVVVNPPSNASQKITGAAQQQIELLTYELKREKDKNLVATKTISDLQADIARVEQNMQDMRDTKGRDDMAHGQQLKAWRDRVKDLTEQIQTFKNATKTDGEMLWQRTFAENNRLKDENARLKSMLSEVTKTAQDLAEKRDTTDAVWSEKERQLRESAQIKLADTVRTMEAQRQSELQSQKEQFDRYMSSKEAEVLKVKSECDRKSRNADATAAAAKRLSETFNALVQQVEDTLATVVTLYVDGGGLERRHLQTLVQTVQKKIELKRDQAEIEENVLHKITALKVIKQAASDAQVKLHSASKSRPDTADDATASIGMTGTAVFYAMKPGAAADPQPQQQALSSSLISPAELAMLSKKPRQELILEIERYRKELQLERKKSQDMLVALRSAQRTAESASSSPHTVRPSSALPASGTLSRPGSAAVTTTARPYSSQSQRQVANPLSSLLMMSTRGVVNPDGSVKHASSERTIEPRVSALMASAAINAARGQSAAGGIPSGTSKLRPSTAR